MNIKNVAVGLTGVGIVGAIALGNSVAFADDSATKTLPPITGSSAPMDSKMGHHGPGMNVTMAAEYLGLTEDALFVELESGKTLAEIAEAQGKSVQGLIDALVADATSRTNEHITNMVNSPLPTKSEGHRHRGGHHLEDRDYSGEDLSEDGSSL
jgi:hypothetical protein